MPLVTKHEQDQQNKIVRGLSLALLALLIFLAIVFQCNPLTLFVSLPTSAPGPTPTLVFTPQEEMERSAYYACAKQFDPSGFDRGFGFEVKTWSIVPYPRWGYFEGRDPNLQPVVISQPEGGLYYVNFFIDSLYVMDEYVPLSGETITTQHYSREGWTCDARYLGKENGNERWNVKIQHGPYSTHGCLHPTDYPANAKTPFPVDVVTCQY